MSTMIPSPAILAALADYTAELAKLDEMDAGRPDGTHSYESATLDVWLREAIRSERSADQAGDQGERQTVPNGAHCCTCRWWAARMAGQNDTDNPRSGQCHLNAPTVVPMGDGTATLWPTTLRYSVCGDWERGS